MLLMKIVAGYLIAGIAMWIFLIVLYGCLEKSLFKEIIGGMMAIVLIWPFYAVVLAWILIGMYKERHNKIES